jgi:hypothetical protein
MQDVENGRCRVTATDRRAQAEARLAEARGNLEVSKAEVSEFIEVQCSAMQCHDVVVYMNLTSDGSGNDCVYIYIAMTETDLMAMPD